jgi:hypothetical protein
MSPLRTTLGYLALVLLAGLGATAAVAPIFAATAIEYGLIAALIPA